MGNVIMSFSNIIKGFRQSLKMSQEELAHAPNVSYVTINCWENGKTEGKGE
jgi:DNA-binding XRE family transcriptional regulator